MHCPSSSLSLGKHCSNQLHTCTARAALFPWGNTARAALFPWGNTAQISCTHALPEQLSFLGETLLKLAAHMHCPSNSLSLGKHCSNQLHTCTPRAALFPWGDTAQISCTHALPEQLSFLGETLLKSAAHMHCPSSSLSLGKHCSNQLHTCTARATLFPWGDTAQISCTHALPEQLSFLGETLLKLAAHMHCPSNSLSLGKHCSNQLHTCTARAALFPWGNTAQISSTHALPEQLSFLGETLLKSAAHMHSPSSSLSLGRHCSNQLHTCTVRAALFPWGNTAQIGCTHALPEQLSFLGETLLKSAAHMHCPSNSLSLGRHCSNQLHTCTAQAALFPWGDTAQISCTHALPEQLSFLGETLLKSAAHMHCPSSSLSLGKHCSNQLHTCTARATLFPWGDTAQISCTHALPEQLSFLGETLLKLAAHMHCPSNSLSLGKHCSNQLHTCTARAALFPWGNTAQISSTHALPEQLSFLGETLLKSAAHMHSPSSSLSLGRHCSNQLHTCTVRATLFPWGNTAQISCTHALPEQLSFLGETLLKSAAHMHCPSSSLSLGRHCSNQLHTCTARAALFPWGNTAQISCTHVLPERLSFLGETLLKSAAHMHCPSNSLSLGKHCSNQLHTCTPRATLFPWGNTVQISFTHALPEQLSFLGETLLKSAAHMHYPSSSLSLRKHCSNQPHTCTARAALFPWGNTAQISCTHALPEQLSFLGETLLKSAAHMHCPSSSLSLGKHCSNQLHTCTARAALFL